MKKFHFTIAIFMDAGLHDKIYSPWFNGYMYKTTMYQYQQLLKDKIIRV
jgi:hypothetical protein